jgi:hypothetical protein
LLFNSEAVVRASFICTQLRKHLNSLLLFLLLISTTDFEKAMSYFSTSSPVFSQAYVLRVRALFSPVKTSFTALSFRSFRNKFVFRYVPSQKAITGSNKERISVCLDSIDGDVLIIALSFHSVCSLFEPDGSAKRSHRQAHMTLADLRPTLLNAVSFDKQLNFLNDLCCQRSGEAPCYVVVVV